MSFKSLVSVVAEQRQEIKQALTLFPYFETWEPDLVAECCRVSSVVEFPPDNIILGPDTGNSHAVYFILDGVCKMLRSLFVTVTRKAHGEKASYKLPTHFTLKDSNFESKNEGYVSRLFKNELLCEKTNVSSLQVKRTDENFLETSTKESSTENEKNEDERVTDREDENSVAEPPESLTPEPLIELKKKKIQWEDQKETAYEVNHHLKVLEECRKTRENMIRVFKKTTPLEKPKNTKCVFLQIGFLLKGASFGLEKSQNENYIMSATKVKCLKIPRRFLLEHNRCNIWNRICLFQTLHLPSEENLFEHYRFDRMWLKEKKTQTANIIALKSLPRYTSASEVPYSIRLAEPQ